MYPMNRIVWLTDLYCVRFTIYRHFKRCLIHWTRRLKESYDKEYNSNLPWLALTACNREASDINSKERKYLFGISVRKKQLDPYCSPLSDRKKRLTRLCITKATETFLIPTLQKLLASGSAIYAEQNVFFFNKMYA